MKKYRALCIYCQTLLGIFASNSLASSFDIDQFVSNMKDRNDQTVLRGTIDSLVITRPQVEFHFGPGELTVFDFGATRPSAIVYNGKGRFLYTPPNEVELGQLVKFTKKESLDEEFEKIAILFTIELDDFPDTSNFIREKATKKAWNILADVVEDAFDHFRIHMPNELIGDLLAGVPGNYFYADFKIGRGNHLAFIENPRMDDKFMLCKLIKIAGVKTYDVLGGYSDDDKLPSQRGVSIFDIDHYRIESRIEGSGKMTVNCRVEYTPLVSGYYFLYFLTYYKNKIESVTDSNGDTLNYIERKTESFLGLTSKKYESGFGIVLNEPTEAGVPDYIDISYECNSLEVIYGIFYLKSKAYWQPFNPIRDLATYELFYDIPGNYEVVSCGNKIESENKDGRKLSRWVIDRPVRFASFNAGIFDSREFIVENLPPVKVYVTKHIPHEERALSRARAGLLSSSDMLGDVGTDVINSLAFYTSILGPCPFDTIKAAETLSWGGGQASPGLIHLSWSTFQYDDFAGYDELLRSHEIAHQWWYHIVEYESYRDVWIIEGLSEYCGLWFYELSARDNKGLSFMRERSREMIFSGRGVSPGDVTPGLNYEFNSKPRSIGSRAGPISIGYRLNSSDSEDYTILVYYKGAYVFHMIRYMLHDYKTGSDDAFAAFLKDIVDTFRSKVITASGLQTLLEKHIGADMSWFFDQWVYGTAIPEYRFSYNSEKTDDGKYQVVCHVEQDKVPDNFQMMVPITVLFEDDRYIHLKIWMDQPEIDIDLPPLPFKPKKIVFNTYDAVLCKVRYR